MSEQSIIPKVTEINKEDSYILLSELNRSPEVTQRQLSLKLNISLGKTNYVLRQLIKKGLIKIKNFTHNPYKLKKIRYMLTKKGMQEKINLTQHFLKIKEDEYHRIKAEWDVLTNKGQVKEQAQELHL